MKPHQAYATFALGFKDENKRYTLPIQNIANLEASRPSRLMDEIKRQGHKIGMPTTSNYKNNEGSRQSLLFETKTLEASHELFSTDGTRITSIEPVAAAGRRAEMTI